MIETGAALAPLTDLQEEKVYDPTQPWSDDFAAKIVVSDFNAAEAYRTQNCDWRWRTANELYVAWGTQKYWEGTKMPRASLGLFVSFEQIESMLPKLLSAIFADNPWFQADPVGQTTAAQAAQWRDTLLDQLDRTRVREIFRRCIKSGLVYGNGIMKLSWTVNQIKRLKWLPQMRPKTEMVFDPMRGMIPQTTGYERVYNRETVTEIENKPELEYVSLTDFYIDPNCPTPQPRDSRFRIRRKLVTVEDLAALRGLKEFKIPGDGQLLDWARYKPSTQADVTKSTEELFRMGAWFPTNDTTVDPGGKRIEVLEYETDDRVAWVANRQMAILNIPNSYGFCTYYDAFYADVLDRFYAMGVCDITEGEQRLQAALLNGRLDELALSLHRPLVKKLGIKMPTYAMRVRPGQIWEADDPSKDFQFLDVPDITASAHIETQASQMRVQKTTGQADLYATGVPSSGGNSASRTATGIGAQVQASGSRIQYLVENLEDTFIEPMLNDLVLLNQMFPPIGTPAAEVFALTKVQLSMRASAKMQARMGLLQTFPLILQTIGNPAFIQELSVQGKTPDWIELMRILTEMTGYKNRADLIRDLTPQEIQARQQQQETPEMVKMAMQRERIAGQEKIQDKRLQLDREKLIAETRQEMQLEQWRFQKDKALLELKAGMEIQQEREKHAVTLTTDRERLQLEAHNKQIEHQLERDRMELEARLEIEKLEAQGVTAENKVLIDVVKALMDHEDSLVSEVERDAEGNIARIKKKRKES